MTKLRWIPSQSGNAALLSFVLSAAACAAGDAPPGDEVNDDPGVSGSNSGAGGTSPGTSGSTTTSSTAGSGVGGGGGSGMAAAGSGGTGIDAGGPLPPGPPGSGSLACDGSGVGVNISSAADLEILGDWTIELWFKDDEAWCHTWRFLVRKGDEFNDPFFIATEDCGVRLGQKSNWNYFTQLENLQADGYKPGWLHVSATYKAAQHLGQIYINGEPKFATEQPMNGAPTALGKPVTMCNSFKGKLDDIRLWNVVRTAADIKTSYTGQLKTWPPELVANWTFDNDAGGTVVHDATSHHHDGMLQKAATLSADVHP